MNKLELLANEIALLSNDSLQKLARVLVEDYDTRADLFQSLINIEFMENPDVRR